MRFLAHQQHRQPALAPHGQIEGQARDHRDHHVQNFRRHGGKVDHRDGTALARHAEQAGQNLAHRVLHRQRPEHEIVALVGDQAFDARLQAAIGQHELGAFQLAQLLVQPQHHVRHAEGRGRVDGNHHVGIVGLAQRAGTAGGGFAVALLGLHHRVGQDFDFRVVMGVAADQRRHHFGEVQHPERQAEIVEIDWLDQTAKGGGIFVVHVQDHDMGMGVIGQETLQDAGDGGRLA